MLPQVGLCRGLDGRLRPQVTAEQRACEKFDCGGTPKWFTKKNIRSATAGTGSWMRWGSGAISRQFVELQTKSTARARIGSKSEKRLLRSLLGRLASNGCTPKAKRARPTTRMLGNVHRLWVIESRRTYLDGTAAAACLCRCMEAAEVRSALGWHASQGIPGCLRRSGRLAAS